MKDIWERDDSKRSTILTNLTVLFAIFLELL